MFTLQGEFVTRDSVIGMLIDRDGDLCYICNEPLGDDITIDHYFPKSWFYKNGRSKEEADELSNLRCTHQKCNGKKGSIVPDGDTFVLPTPRKTRAQKRAERPVICQTCFAGRVLLIGEICPDCGSGPQPSVAPRSLQSDVKNCDHSTHHCWMCWLGFIPRKAAILTVLDAEVLDD